MVDSILHHKKVSTELVGNLQYGVPKLCTNLRSNAEMLFKRLPSAIIYGFERNECGFSIATLPLAGMGMDRNSCRPWDHLTTSFVVDLVTAGVER